MQIYGQPNQRSLNLILTLLVDWLVEQINQDHVLIAITLGLNGFKIWLVKDRVLDDQIKIDFQYRYGGYADSVAPINKFQFELIKGTSVVLEARSNDAESYDALLRLYRAGLAQMARHNPEHYALVMN